MGTGGRIRRIKAMRGRWRVRVGEKVRAEGWREWKGDMGKEQLAV